MRFIILPFLRLLSFLFACACFLFVLPWLLLWHFTWTDARDAALAVFEGIVKFNPEIFCPACILTVVLTSGWWAKFVILLVNNLHNQM